MAELETVEARLWSLLEPYRGELESATIYGLPSLRWPGTKAHDYFAAVRAGKSYVSLYLVVADTYPAALEGTPDTLLKRRSGKAAFTFSHLDDEMARDLEGMLARLYARYQRGSRPSGDSSASGRLGGAGHARADRDDDTGLAFAFDQARQLPVIDRYSSTSPGRLRRRANLDWSPYAASRSSRDEPIPTPSAVVNSRGCPSFG